VIIADPYGSWVQGAKEGLTSSIALRNAEDEAAQHAYALQRAHQFDPYNLQELQARAKMEGINADIAGQYGIPMAKAQLEQQQFKVPEAAATFGYTNPLLQYFQQQNPNVQFDPNGNLISSLHGTQGDITTATPFANIRSPQDMMMQLRAMGINNLEEYRQAIEGIRRRDELRKEGALTTTPNNSVLKGLPEPPAPTGQFNTPRTTVVGPMTQGNQFNNVQAGSSTLPSSAGAYNLNAQTRYGPNIYSDVQNNPTVQNGTAVPRGKRNLYNLQY